ncbi:MAG: hypothetical protein ACYDHD_00230 [Vulcanimicrobiaceae bacterium]
MDPTLVDGNVLFDGAITEILTNLSARFGSEAPNVLGRLVQDQRVRSARNPMGFLRRGTRPDGFLLTPITNPSVRATVISASQPPSIRDESPEDAGPARLSHLPEDFRAAVEEARLNGKITNLLYAASARLSVVDDAPDELLLAVTPPLLRVLLCDKLLPVLALMRPVSVVPNPGYPA